MSWGACVDNVPFVRGFVAVLCFLFCFMHATYSKTAQWHVRAFAAVALPLLVGAAVALITQQAMAAGSKKKTPEAVRSYEQHSAAQAWAQEVAARQGWTVQWVRQQLARAHFSATSQRLMTPTPASTQTPRTTTVQDWRAYRARLITPDRIAAGVQFWQRNAAALERAEDVFGVSAATIVGILGVETHYGRHMGNVRVLDALATLAFDFPPSHPRAAQRSAYFAQELETFLAMMAEAPDAAAQQAVANLRGSYAGAMGMGQFMPSSRVRWALDFDEDGHIDLFASREGGATDAIGSVANYLHAHGWVRGLPVAYVAEFAWENTDLSTLLAPDIVPSFSAGIMAAQGVRVRDASGARVDDGVQPLALVELRQGSAPAAYFVGTRNFYALTRYNWSSYYAAAVYDLGQEVAHARSAAATSTPAQAPTIALTQPVRSAQP